ncbi:lon-related putative ATP-dependent protease [Desulfobaculum xiamenense]|uniref:endopeptidase La n=1 Tax=Desulfobaculum xiamenense TaxID=995050 RepID=A0A846QTT5_9BACT|nr:ATP-binding protein [Desulfobaculum xiamenense]NJB68049.1 lon-related putative ATP-dependent protease [Desulfobaculum xiamenense]
MARPRPLSVKKLRAEMDPESISYADSREISEYSKVKPPQPRALMALEMGLAIDDPGYNVYVAGDPNLGRTYLVRQFLEPRAAKMPRPRDLAYVYNFLDPDRPRILSLPAGGGKRLKKALDAAIADIRREVPEKLEQDSFARKSETLLRTFQDRREEMLRDMEQRASAQGFELEVDEQGGMTLYPLVEGKVVTEVDFDRLDSDLRTRLKKRGDDLLAEMTKSLRRLTRDERDYREDRRKLERGVVTSVMNRYLGPLTEEYADDEGVSGFLKALRADIIESMDQFLPSDAAPPTGMQALFDSGSQDDFFVRYTISRFVDNCAAKGAPIVFENHPTISNLLGSVEREAEMGALYTDFTLIKSGALHRANGGFLVLRMEDLIQVPDAWDGLLRALRAGKSKIEDLADHEAARTKTIEPEPVPLSVKVVLIGSDELYETLFAVDDRFSKLFKLKAHMQDTVPRTATSIKGYLGVLARMIRDGNFQPFDRGALAGLVDHASRMAEDQQKLSLRLPLVRELMIEASALARMEGHELVTRELLEKASRNRDFRANLYEEEFMGDYDRQLIKVATSGSGVGRVNGLAVTMFGDYEFGLPHQISCTVGVGHGGILDLEREAELGGPIHTKGMMILKSCLLRLFAQDKPLVLTGSLCFEQSYVEVEGDSASGAELAALLSAISGVPIDHSLAFTGAVSQTGAIMAVGGVTRKIEGFFQVCKRRGLNGNQGVIVPQDNVVHLMLGTEVVEAVRDGKFHIYPVSTIEQAMETLTGLPAGKRRASGSFPAGTLYRRVDDRLAELAELAAKQQPDD